MKRRIVALTMTILVVFASFTNVFAYSDDRILTDPVVNTYTGRLEATDMIRNANFTDIPADYWAREAIARTVALNLVKGYDTEYKPEDSVTNQDAIAYAIRAVNMEDAAQAAGVALQATFPNNSSVKDLWALGYLQLALTSNVITQAQYNDALVADQTTLDPAVNFIRGADVTREQAADWLVKTIEFVSPNLFQLGTTQQSIYKYSDWDTISPAMVASVEKLSMDGIMSGDINGNFNPKAKVTRAEMAQILRNMDTIYNNFMGYTKKTGTIGAVVEADARSTGNLGKSKNIYVRTSEGTVDVIKYETNINTSPQPQSKDAVVYTTDNIGGLNILNEEEQIEYLVRPSDNTILYVQKTGTALEIQVQGKLDNIDQPNNSITIRDAKGNKTTYKLMEGIIRNNLAGEPCIYMDIHERLIKDLPTGSTLKLTLKNNIVIILNYIGEPELHTDIKGIVTENNPQLGYITVIDNEGKEITKNYYQNTIKVEKQQYYDVMDEIGYIDSVFPNFEYDPRDTFIDDIEAGDIIFLTIDPTDDQIVSAVSAVSNYNIKYGKVKQTQQNDSYISLLMEYENKQTEWIDIPNDIFVSKDTRPAQLTDILTGDWLKVLVNEAIISPGYTIQSAKEVTIEGAERYVSQIYKSQLSGINQPQQEIVLKNVEALGTTGWSDYQQIKNISINNSSGVEYYYNGKQISLDFALQRLKNGYETYVATENSFGGEKAIKVSFRDSRDELLNKDSIIYSDGNGLIGTTNKSDISTDAGTIVVRHGRLTEAVNVMVPDYASISLNGENKAAVVNIENEPNTSGLMIARGRIKSINEGKSFQVQSMALLNGMKWAYTPIQRVFSIDYDTKFYDADGWVEQSSFIDYTDETKVDKVYNIITDGTRAIQVIDAPYATQGIRGTIYAIEENVVKIKDAYIYGQKTGAWTALSNKNSALNITLPENYIIGKDNQSVGISSLKVGNQIRVLTDVLAEKPTEANTINGYITMIEK